MFRPNDPFARQPPFGFDDDVAPYGQDGEALVGVKTHLGWARPRWTPSGSMWLDGEDFSLPLNRFDVRTLEPVFGRAETGDAGPSGGQPLGRSPAPKADERGDLSPAPPTGQRPFVAVDTHLGRATPHWSPSGMLSLEIDGVRRPLHHFSADQMTPLYVQDLAGTLPKADRNETRAGRTMRGNLASNVLHGGGASDTLASGAGTDTLLDGPASDTLVAGAKPDDLALPRGSRFDWLVGPPGSLPPGDFPPKPQAPKSPIEKPRARQPEGAAPLVEGTEVIWPKIEELETRGGAPDLKGHIVTRHGVADANSGVTVGNGIDLGWRSVKELQRWNLKPALVAKLTPWIGLRGSDALAALRRTPEGVQLTQAESDALTQATRRDVLQSVRDKFNAASTVGRFEDLPPNTQTAIASLYFQFGPNAMGDTPRFWSAITGGSWQQAYEELMHFGPSDRPRREAEARMMLEDINAGLLPKPRPSQ